MGRGLSIAWRGIVDLYSELFPMIGMNVIWFGINIVLGVLCLPVLLLAGTLGIPAELASLLLVVLMVMAPNPAAAGIHNYANQLVKEERVEFALVWEGLRRYWARALLLFAICVLGFVLLVANAAFYLGNESQVLKIIGIIWIYAMYVWLSMQIYMLPLLVEQESKSIWFVIRNAAILALDNPFVTFTLLLVFVVLTGLSLAIPIFITLLCGALIGVIQHRAALTLLEKYRKKKSSGLAS